MLPPLRLYGAACVRQSLLRSSPAVSPALRLVVFHSASLAPIQPPCRQYASKAKGAKHKASKHASESPDEEESSDRRPGPASEDPLADELTKAEAKMRSAVDWYKREVGNMETRGSGRVTPAMLDGIRVALPDRGGGVKLDEVATVGVREGNILVVTLFDESQMKPVKTALQSDRYGFVPQVVDQRTIRIPIPRPTAEDREKLVKSAGRLAEDARVKVRHVREACIKTFRAEGLKDKKDRHYTKIQKLTDTHVEEINEILKGLKQTLA